MPVSLHHIVDGRADAPALLLAHSLGTDLELFAPQVPALARRFRVVRADLRGHGASPVPAGPYRLDELGADVLALLDELGLARVHFCGVSIGGLIGLWLAVRAPERLGRLVVANSVARIGTAEQWDARAAAVRLGGLEAIAGGSVDRWFTPRFRVRAGELVERTRRTLVTMAPAGYLGCCAALRDADLRADLAAIRAPTLVVAGAADAATPPADCRLLAERIPGARYLELPAAHLANLEAADLFTAAASDFLSRS